MRPNSRASRDASLASPPHFAYRPGVTFMIFSFQDTPLELSVKQKYLGVGLSNDLDWSHHINSITTRANKTLGLLRLTLKSCSPYIKNIAYKTLVRPQLEYCSPIWDPYEKGHILLLEKVQRRAARFVTNMVSNIGWQSLEERRAIARLTLMYKIVHGVVHTSTSPLLQSGCQTHNTSHLSYLRLQSNTNCYRSSFFPRTIQEFNSVPLTLRCATSTHSFKNGLSNLNILRIINTGHYCNQDR